MVQALVISELAVVTLECISTFPPAVPGLARWLGMGGVGDPLLPFSESGMGVGDSAELR